MLFCCCKSQILIWVLSWQSIGYSDLWQLEELSFNEIFLITKFCFEFLINESFRMSFRLNFVSISIRHSHFGENLQRKPFRADSLRIGKILFKILQNFCSSNNSEIVFSAIIWKLTHRTHIRKHTKVLIKVWRPIGRRNIMITLKFTRKD